MIIFQRFMADLWFSLFFHVSASNINIKLIVTKVKIFGNPNQFQREFDSNVCIATFETVLASSTPSQKTNFFKQSLFCSLPLRSGGGVLSLRAAEKRAGDGGCFHSQTESKGNFCLITVYSHKTFPQPQALLAKKQTFSNKSLHCSLSLRSGAK
jgi:hypothetical protein